MVAVVAVVVGEWLASLALARSGRVASCPAPGVPSPPGHISSSTPPVSIGRVS